jgi:hypothetical protein
MDIAVSVISVANTCIKYAYPQDRFLDTNFLPDMVLPWSASASHTSTVTWKYRKQY